MARKSKIVPKVCSGPLCHFKLYNIVFSVEEMCCYGSLAARSDHDELQQFRGFRDFGPAEPLFPFTPKQSCAG